MKLRSVVVVLAPIVVIAIMWGIGIVMWGISINRAEAAEPYCSVYCQTCYLCADPPTYENYCCGIDETVYDGNTDLECIALAMDFIDRHGSKWSECNISGGAQ